MRCGIATYANLAWVFADQVIASSQNWLMCGIRAVRMLQLRNPLEMEDDMTRDELNKELRMHSATWQSVVLVYACLVGTLVLSAMAVLS